MARFQQNGILPATGALVAVLLFSGGAGAGPWMAPPPPPDAPEELRTAIEKADQLFRKRHVAQEDLIAHLEAVVARWPRSWDAQWRMARAASWSAELAKDRKVRRGWGEVAWKAAEKAVQLEPGRAEGHYWLAAGAGNYAASVGMITAIRRGLEPKVREALLAAERLDERVENGGALVALGRYRSEAPWPIRDLNAAVGYLGRALEIHPEGLRARVYLAEALAARRADGDEAAARVLFRQVLEAPLGRYDLAEERRALELAHEALARLKWNIEGVPLRLVAGGETR